MGLSRKGQYEIDSDRMVGQGRRRDWPQLAVGLVTLSLIQLASWTVLNVKT